MSENVEVIERRGASGPSKRKRRRESNPVLLKELRGRMRGARAFVVLTVYLLLLSCFASVIYYAYAATSRSPGGGPEMAYLGKVLFSSVILIEIFMVTFITPAFTAGALSGERERQTYELLRTTLLPARKLVFGKLTSALVYMFLLILAAVPLESLAFMLGGVVVEELGLALILLLVTAFAFATIGLLFSSIMRTTLVSTVLTYAVALLLTIGLPVLVLIIFVLLVEPLSYATTTSIPWIWEAVLMYALIFVASLSPISAAVVTEVFLLEQDAILYFWTDVGYMFGSGPAHHIPLPSPWVLYALIYLVLGMLFLLVAMLRVRQQEKR